MMIFHFRELAPIERYKLLSSTVVPRPIAWISTISPEGVPNAAPFSFSNVFGEDPPVVGFSINDRRPGDRKDTGNNVRRSGDFVFNLVSETLSAPMNVTAAEFRPEVDEFAEAGLTPLPSLTVSSPRIAESPVSFECRLLTIVELGPGRSLVLGEVQVMHVADEAVLDKARYHIDTQKLRMLGRMQGNSYVRTGDVFEIPRLVPDPAKIAV
jgi:flavin reductase (DIM6/NTAB) family NADH-FMN oxidoreductase RutF